MHDNKAANVYNGPIVIVTSSSRMFFSLGASGMSRPLLGLGVISPWLYKFAKYLNDNHDSRLPGWKWRRPQGFFNASSCWDFSLVCRFWSPSSTTNLRQSPELLPLQPNLAAGFLNNHKPTRPMAVVRGYVFVKKSRKVIATSDTARGTSTNTIITAWMSPLKTRLTLAETDWRYADTSTYIDKIR